MGELEGGRDVAVEDDGARTAAECEVDDGGEGGDVVR